MGRRQDGARELFAARLTELHKAAGSPPLESIAKRVMARRPPGARWRVTGRRISDWKLGRNVPESADAFAAVVRRLIELARARVHPSQASAELLDEAQWQQWRLAARAEPIVPATKPAPSTEPVGHLIRDLDPIDLEV